MSGMYNQVTGKYLNNIREIRIVKLCITLSLIDGIQFRIFNSVLLYVVCFEHHLGLPHV